MEEYESLDALNGHPLCVERCRHNLTQKQLADKAQVGVTTIWRAENDYPISAESRQRLCDYFRLSSQELGLHGKMKRKSAIVEPQKAPALPPVATTPSMPNMPNHALRYQRERRNWSQEQVAEALLSLHGPTKRGEVNARMISKWERGVQTPNLEYRKLLCQLYEVQSPEDLSFLKREVIHLSVPVQSSDDLAQLQAALEESIGAGWKLFHTASNAQVLAIGQALLTLLQQNHSSLPSRIRATYYSSVYNLIGVAFSFQEKYQLALDVHINAHLASEATGEAWNIIQSLICLANVYQALGHFDKVTQILEEAFHVLGGRSEVEYVRTKAHLLGCYADSAMIRGDFTTAQRQLEASETLLYQIGPSQEFDITSWLHLAANLALATKNYPKAISLLEKALSLPQTSYLRRASTSVTLAVAYLYKDENASLAVIEQNVSIIEMVNAPLVNKQLADYIQRGLLVTSPDDKRVQTFISDIFHRIPFLNGYIAAPH